ncbi:glycosyltransferase family 2 protein [Polaribacter sp. Z014]|uniref:glycosyltransferase family 2 protein n=1 Tax=Polaribacter sp. Z014 TaxID=2927126 RepID=UPI00202029DC|nr:glycosyltransferase family A protein [Polaribacter sp. Z014]MCL7764205.1 glycosyltransferase family 2 protein [Polaribacter sp. Z014]
MNRVDISVIIPVYNADKYIEKAIKSSLIQKEVDEIIIIDDGSTDNSLKICLNICETENRIKIYYHKNHENLGRSASRNLGIKMATSKYIAFLDADDFYLPNRFTNDFKIFNKDNSVDGVYNAIGSFFYREFDNIEKEKLKLTTVSEKIKANELFDKMGPMGHYGYFSGIGLTVKKDSFLKCGFFNETLQVAEDTELWLRMALVLNLKSGIIDEPIALRGVHDTNVSFKRDDLYQINNLKMYFVLLEWMFQKKISFIRINKVWTKFWNQNLINNTSFWFRIKYWVVSLCKHPILLKSITTYKSFPILRLFK